MNKYTERRFLETVSFGRHWDMSSILNSVFLTGICISTVCWSLCPSTIRAVNKWLQATNRLGVQPPHLQPCSTMINCIGLTWPKSSSTKTDVAGLWLKEKILIVFLKIEQNCWMLDIKLVIFISHLDLVLLISEVLCDPRLNPALWSAGGNSAPPSAIRPPTTPTTMTTTTSRRPWRGSTSDDCRTIAAKATSSIYLSEFSQFLTLLLLQRFDWINAFCAIARNCQKMAISKSDSLKNIN